MNSTKHILDILIQPADIKKHGGLISDEDLTVIQNIFGYVLIVMSQVGVVTNCINIKTFVRMGLGEGISVILMGLAASDLGFTLSTTVMGSCNILCALEKNHDGFDILPIHPLSIFMFLTNVCLMFFQATCMITTFIAIARCLCVAMPFKFKNFLTPSRSILTLAVSYLTSILILIPVLSLMGLQPKFDSVVNRTRFVLWLSINRKTLKNLVLLIQSCTTFCSSVIVVGVCILIMAKYLKQSEQFRQVSTKGGIGSYRRGAVNEDLKLSGRELQIIRQIIIICLIHTLCTIPMSFMASYRFTDPEFESDRRLHNFYFTGSYVTITVFVFNAATTFPVYYNYNSKFRAQCFIW